jgi:hypothetical protein
VVVYGRFGHRRQTGIQHRGNRRRCCAQQYAAVHSGIYLAKNSIKGWNDMGLTTAVTLITEIGVLLGVIIPVIVWIGKIANGQKCQLRNDMLRIYYRNRETGEIRQYEYENFVFLYEAYKALKGNSFIDKIYKEVQTWEVVSQ